MLTHLFELTHGQREEGDKLLLVLADAHSCDLRQAFKRHVAEHGHVQELQVRQRCSVQPFALTRKHFHVTPLHTLYTNVLISLVSKMYPRGIQLRKRSRVSRVAWTRGAFWEFS